MRGIYTVFLSLTNPEGRSFSELNEMYRSLYEDDVFGRGGMLDNGQNIRNYLNDDTCLSALVPGCCIEPITEAELIEVLSYFLRQNSPGHDGLPNKFYSSIPLVFRNLTDCVYSLWKKTLEDFQRCDEEWYC